MKNNFIDLMSILDKIENTVIEINLSVEEKQTKSSRSSFKDEIDSYSKAKENQTQIQNRDKRRKQWSEKRRQLAKEVSEKARVANKRLDRLEKNGLQNHSAYKAWLENGGTRFSVKGKNYQQLQREYWRVQKFLDSETSTITGAKKNMQRIATDIVRVDSSKVGKMNLQDLKSLTSNFFKIRDRIQEKYKDMGEGAKAIDYQKIMNEISVYIARQENELAGIMSEIVDIDGLANQIMNYIEMEQKDITDSIVGW